MLRARARNEFQPAAYAAVPRALSALLVCSTIFSSCVLPASAADGDTVKPGHRRIAQAMLSIQKTLLRISPPTSGVRLLEEVFQRVRSAPQVAMAKNLMQQQQSAQTLSQNKGRTDYTLAIRPKQAGKSALLPSPTLAMLPPSNAPHFSEGAYSATRIPPPPAGFEPNANVGGVVAAAPPPPAGPESWLGARQYPSAAFKDQNGYTVVNGNRQNLNAAQQKGLWENSVALRPNSATTLERAASESIYGDEGTAGDNYNASGALGGGGGGSPRSVKMYQPPDLATAANRFLNTARALEDAQAGGGARLQALAPSAQKKSEATAYKTLAKEQQVASLTPQEVAASKPFSTNAPAANMGKAVHLDADEESAADSKSRPERKAKKAPYSGYDKARARREKVADDLDSLENEKRDTSKLAWRPGDIALLPPNVVTGIPLVRLGISEGQASNALTTMGSMKQDKVNKWTVWSWQRAQNKTQTALQLYMRNGLLDAMRIFDAGLIAPDFGVRMGDDLSRVKEKFGEPAFILQEPEPGAGQNYIYPISQVGFQLARPEPGQQPKVVSILIFNVK